MLEVRFELTTSSSSPTDDAMLKALVRWARTGKWFTDHLPKLVLMYAVYILEAIMIRAKRVSN